MTAFSTPLVAQSAEVNVAVAANFTAPMKLIAQSFEQKTGHKAILAFGGTGQFYAQIRHGAPFGVLLAADQETPSRLESEGFAVKGTSFTYATGQLVLWSRQPDLIKDSADVLKTARFQRIAIANPKLAPYGRAAYDVLDKLDLLSTVKPKVVEGSNIAQTFQFVSSGNAQIGFVALSQVLEKGQIREGSGWIVPGSLYEPIRQDAVLLSSGQDNPAATALLEYLHGDKAKAVIESFGYVVQ
ncbi:molybdate ABC transporter substrate-binding protein [Orrella marina]|uniref:Molybdate ABC transporter substrate-binding protein n=1 Tax=Orrella marina TaxID=2163011 RepID=A0A2R4XP92_9BURK|nr:molybdate ABC transporter substrate-binding protein [Orrella marina]AWB35578.1 molybdate ABC transporter substrate-binding protein [Orrella marina]